MNPKEAVAKLYQLRVDFQNGIRSAEETEKLGKEYVDIYNQHSREVAKKYGVKPSLMPNKVIYYPTRLWR